MPLYDVTYRLVNEPADQHWEADADDSISALQLFNRWADEMQSSQNFQLTQWAPVAREIRGQRFQSHPSSVASRHTHAPRHSDRALALDTLLLDADFGELVAFARQALDDVIEQLNQDEGPTEPEGDIVDALARARNALHNVEQSQ